MRTFIGECHCGAVGVEYSSSVEPSETIVRACQCSFCRKHGACTIGDQDGQVRFIEKNAGALLRYRFGLMTADYMICGRCGVYLGAVLNEDGAGYAIVNVLTLLERSEFNQVPQAMTYDGENIEQRKDRRRKNWTPVTGF